MGANDTEEIPMHKRNSISDLGYMQGTVVFFQQLILRPHQPAGRATKQ